MNDTRPIGLFDSGLGGLSVWREVARRLPHESTVYFADSANCPYGSRPLAEIRQMSAAITRFLLQQGCKMIVVACNTASAAALQFLRAEFEVPIIGLEPALKPAAEASRTGHVGVLATAGTFQGDLFQNTARRHANGVEIHLQVGTGLVEQVEAGGLAAPETEALLRRYLEPMLAANVDQIALGCTHYPLLMPLIRRIVGDQATVIDPAEAVARQVERVLARQELAAGPARPAYVFYTTGQLAVLQDLVRLLEGERGMSPLPPDGGPVFRRLSSLV